MKTITNEELVVILEKHTKWQNKKFGGERADLREAFLCGAYLCRSDLRGADLRGAYLYGADLYGADLSEANLRGADLYRADLSGANLSEANLSEANFYIADLSGADLRGANLRGANLKEADLSGADLRGANLRGANLRGANLKEANLYGADLSGADLRGANLSDAIIDYPIACPEKGSFIAFKKANGYIIELLIPEDALRCSSTSRKCRCSKAKVISITNFDGTESCITSVPSNYDPSFVYTIGETVEEPDFNPDRWNEYSKGIHFFVNRQEAINY